MDGMWKINLVRIFFTFHRLINKTENLHSTLINVTVEKDYEEMKIHHFESETQQKKYLGSS